MVPELETGLDSSATQVPGPWKGFGEHWAATMSEAKPNHDRGRSPEASFLGQSGQHRTPAALSTLSIF